MAAFTTSRSAYDALPADIAFMISHMACDFGCPLAAPLAKNSYAFTVS